jgi:hypothetical protein
MPSYDQNIAAAGEAADGLASSAHVEEFRHACQSAISLFRNMLADGWKRAGIASDKHVTVLALAFIIAGHAAHHGKILRARYRGALRARY